MSDNALEAARRRLAKFKGVLSSLTPEERHVLLNVEQDEISGGDVEFECRLNAAVKRIQPVTPKQAEDIASFEGEEVAGKR